MRNGNNKVYDLIEQALIKEQLASLPTLDKVKRAVNQARRHKTTGLDGTPVEALKERAYVLSEFLDSYKQFSASKSGKPVFSYGYESYNGPHMWKHEFPECAGENQSPVNIVTRQVVAVNSDSCLVWSGYSCQPLSMRMSNECGTAVIRGEWPSNLQPHITGGPLEFSYEFHSMSFHWGPSDHDGSEHTIDYLSYPLELQMLHCKRGFRHPMDVVMVGAKDGIVILAFLFEITAVDNPYLDHIVNNLWRVASPSSCVPIPPFPLDWLYAPFKHCYYTYNGSLTQPPCSEVVTWIIQSDPIAISSQQVAQFRRLHSKDGPIFYNSRPVQHMNCRHVYYYE
ncbi:carbonic anhydrase 1-like [Anabrus simplex]|uniref:carbonic anhydrase 1-like n=1 Tax=Anabrus simplex TaxID=316456 RepID=UPI0035A261DB